MIVRRTASDISAERDTLVWRSVMSTNSLTSIHRRSHFREHLRITIDHTGKVHHLAQTDDPGPRHGLCNILGGYFKPCGLKSGCGRRTRRHLRIDVHGLHQGFVVHHPDAFKTQHIRDLMWVSEHRRCAMRNNGSRKFSRGQHTTFDMHMAIAQTGNEVATSCINHFGLRSNTMRRIRSNIGKAPFDNRHLPAIQNFTRLNINQTSTLDHKIRVFATSSDGDQAGGDLGPRFKVMFHSQWFHRFETSARGAGLDLTMNAPCSHPGHAYKRKQAAKVTLDSLSKF